MNGGGGGGGQALALPTARATRYHNYICNSHHRLI